VLFGLYRFNLSSTLKLTIEDLSETQPENDTIIHASCHLNIYSYGESYSGGDGFAGMNGSILQHNITQMKSRFTSPII